MAQLNKQWTSPSDVKVGDYCALKIIAVAGYGNKWAAYYGPTDWTDDEVRMGGTKMLKEEAGIFAYLFQLMEYR